MQCEDCRACEEGVIQLGQAWFALRPDDRDSPMFRTMLASQYSALTGLLFAFSLDAMHCTLKHELSFKALNTVLATTQPTLDIYQRAPDSPSTQATGAADHLSTSLKDLTLTPSADDSAAVPEATAAIADPPTLAPVTINVVSDPGACSQLQPGDLRNVLWVVSVVDNVVHLAPTADTSGPRVSLSHPWDGKVDDIRVTVQPSESIGLLPWHVSLPTGLLEVVTDLTSRNLPVWIDLLCLRQEAAHKAAQIPIMGAIFSSTFTLPVGPNGPDFDCDAYSRRMWTMQESILGNVIAPTSPRAYRKLVADLADSSLLVDTTLRIISRSRSVDVLEAFFAHPSPERLSSVCSRLALEVGGNAASISGTVFRELLDMPPLVQNASLAFVLLALLKCSPRMRRRIFKLVRLTASMTLACNPTELTWTADPWYLTEALRRQSTEPDDWVHAAYSAPFWFEFGRLLPPNPVQAKAIASACLKLPCIYIPAPHYCSWPHQPPHSECNVPWGTRVAVYTALLNVDGDRYHGSLTRPVRLYYDLRSHWFGVSDGGAPPARSAGPDQTPRHRVRLCVQLVGVQGLQDVTSSLPHIFKGRTGPFLRYGLALQMDEMAVGHEFSGTMDWLAQGLPGLKQLEWTKAWVV
eukprot:m.139392 g.139392  ORF g.139392 m.139392 type:complete len:635 (-) comp16087_c0_seq1:188-2092(-)